MEEYISSYALNNGGVDLSWTTSDIGPSNAAKNYCDVKSMIKKSKEYSMGASLNHVDRFLDFFDPPPPPQRGPIYTYDVDHFWDFSTPPPPPRSTWFKDGPLCRTAVIHVELWFNSNIRIILDTYYWVSVPFWRHWLIIVLLFTPISTTDFVFFVIHEYINYRLET